MNNTSYILLILGLVCNCIAVMTGLGAAIQARRRKEPIKKKMIIIALGFIITGILMNVTSQLLQKSPESKDEKKEVIMEYDLLENICSAYISETAVNRFLANFQSELTDNEIKAIQIAVSEGVTAASRPESEPLYKITFLGYDSETTEEWTVYPDNTIVTKNGVCFKRKGPVNNTLTEIESMNDFSTPFGDRKPGKGYYSEIDGVHNAYIRQNGKIVRKLTSSELGDFIELVSDIKIKEESANNVNTSYEIVFQQDNDIITHIIKIDKGRKVYTYNNYEVFGTEIASWISNLNLKY